MSSTQMNPVSTEGNVGDGNNTLDPLSLASTVGTWVAAFIAVVALLGIVPIYFAITASMSDKTRAMNAVQDRNQEYITRGLKVYQGLRIFRRIRALDLAPSYATNGDDTRPLIPEAAAIGFWTLRATDNFQDWNSGWAKLSKLIESYSVGARATKRAIDLGITRDGTLEIVNSRTALVVHKHWILLLGLLGRYGHRHDGGILLQCGILRAFPGERGGIGVTENGAPGQMFGDDSSSSESFDGSDESYGSDLIPPARDSVGSSHFTVTDSSLPEKRRHSDEPFPRLRIYRQPWGSTAIGEEGKPLTGITGTMQYIGRHKGSWSYLTSVVFFPHTARSIFPPPTTSKPETSPLHVLYWLAHGFLPCSRASGEGDRVTVICLETPSDDIGHRYHKKIRKGRPTVTFFGLEESNSIDIPLSVSSSMNCLGMPKATVRHFVPLAPPLRPEQLWEYTSSIIAKDPFFAHRQRSQSNTLLWELKLKQMSQRSQEIVSSELDTDHSSSLSGNHRVGHSNESPISIYSDEDWVLVPTRYGAPWRFYRRRDIEVMLEALFSLEWDPWGYLVWRQSTQFWRRLLGSSTGILRQKELPIDQENIRAIIHTRPHFWIPQWRIGESFHAKKTAQLAEFENFLHDHLVHRSLPIKPLYVPIAVLFTLDPSFQTMLQKLMRVAAARRYGRADSNSIWINPQLHPLLEPLGVCRDSRPANGSAFKEKPLRRRKHRKSPAYISPPRPEVCLINGHLDTPKDLQGNASGSLNPPQVRESATVTKPVDLLGEFFYDYATKALTWRFRHETQGDTVTRSWKLMDSGLAPGPGAESTVSLDPGDVIAVGLWAAVRSTLWLSSQDSKPLLEFVSELDHYVFVV